MSPDERGPKGPLSEPPARFTADVRAVEDHLRTEPEIHIANDPCLLNTPTKPSGRIGDAVELDL